MKNGNYIRNPTTSCCHIGGDDIEVDLKGVVPDAPCLALEIDGSGSLLHSRYFILCDDCSTFISVTLTYMKHIKEQNLPKNAC